MEIEVALPRKWYKWVNTFEGNNFREKLENFNKALENGELKELDRVIEFPLNRTPADDLHSIEYARVKRFFPAHLGPKGSSSPLLHKSSRQPPFGR